MHFILPTGFVCIDPGCEVAEYMNYTVCYAHCLLEEPYEPITESLMQPVTEAGKMSSQFLLALRCLKLDGGHL